MAVATPLDLGLEKTDSKSSEYHQISGRQQTDRKQSERRSSGHGRNNSSGQKLIAIKGDFPSFIAMSFNERLLAEGKATLEPSDSETMHEVIEMTAVKAPGKQNPNLNLPVKSEESFEVAQVEVANEEQAETKLAK